VTLSDVASCPVPSEQVTSVPAIQGEGATSPLVGQSVTVRGVVTLDAQKGLRGLYMQDARGDGKAETSDGIFVFTA
jgi:predicted extracellular nuclease